jgi:hypothetical protein
MGHIPLPVVGRAHRSSFSTTMQNFDFARRTTLL